MACGAPVVTSAVGAVPEVGGDAVLYVNGDSPSAIAAAMSELLGDEARRAELGAAARRRALAHFSAARRREDLARVLDSVRRREGSSQKIAEHGHAG
jgi:glycosyltransferase involved in cell wall biosynthesis